jgi:hypothetical protein
VLLTVILLDKMSAARQGRAVTACGHSPPALRSVDGAQPSSGPLRTEELILKRDARESYSCGAAHDHKAVQRGGGAGCID